MASRKRACTSASSPINPGATSSNRSLDRSATPLKVFWPCTAMLYPRASNGSRGKASSVHLISCRQTMSGCRSASQLCRLSMRWRMELTFQVAIRMVFWGSRRRIRLYSPCLPASAGICTGKRLYARTNGNAGAKLVGETSHSANYGASGQAHMSPDRKLPMIKRTWLIAGAAVALIGIAVFARGFWTTDGVAARSQGQARVVPVEIATADRKTMPVRLTALGNVTPMASVAIKTQVDTTITGVHFRDGAMVQKGDLLFTLDCRQIQADMKRVQAII